ncbi:MAG: ribosome silencing factor [Eubacteriales bacterium]|nr:ribosome silencing factor [Eubacteriales bacterium]
MQISEETLNLVKITVNALKDKKGIDIKVIDVSEITPLADYFIIASGSNANQVKALCDNVEEQVFKAGYKDPKVEGYNTASWILLDYSEVVVHIFSEDDRAFYGLERVWKDGKDIEIDSL